MATGERPLTSGKLKWSPERLEDRLQAVETQLVLHEDTLYPQRYMAQVAFRTAWDMMSPLHKEERQIMDTPGLLRRSEWLRQRERFNRVVMDDLHILDLEAAHQQALDEWRAAKEHKDDALFSNGFTQFVNPFKHMLGSMASNAVALQVGDFSRAKKTEEYDKYVTSALASSTGGLFLDIEDREDKEIVAQRRLLRNVVHLTYRRELYRSGDKTLLMVRAAQANLSESQRQQFQATPEQGRDDVVTEEIEIPELLVA